MERDKTYTLDIECNGLLADMLDYSSFPYKLKEDAKLWVVVITDVKTREVKKAVNDEITKEWMQEALQDCKVLVAHNGIKFDFITLKLFGVLDYTIGYPNQNDTLFGEDVIFVDTLILSRLTNPDRFGGHSLKAWGQRIGNYKDDFRQKCIDEGIIEKNAPPIAEFQVFSDVMVEYCIQDTLVNVDVYYKLLGELKNHNWRRSIKKENKLADLGVRRETLGFWFDKEFALECLDDLTQKMDELAKKVEPMLPPKPMNKGELKEVTPPKKQIKQDGTLTSYMEKFVDKMGAEIIESNDGLVMGLDGQYFDLPYHKPVRTHIKATINDLDHVKMTLINVYGWQPSEWRERDLTKDSKKISLPYEKRIAALERWYKETMSGKYRRGRLTELGIHQDAIIPKLSARLENDFPVRVPTSPPIRVGVEKELCPNLIKLGDSVSFAKDFAMYLTYKHRKSSIAGGDLEDVDFDEEYPNTGFLSSYREEDGRIPTPAIEIGAVTNRYTHIGVANIPRATSEYGKEMRSLFGCGEGAVFFGFDYSSLEARIMAHYVYKYPQGIELGKQFIAEKPNDWHTSQAEAMGISRTDAKSVDYGLIYGAQIKKLMKMLNVSEKRAKEIYNTFWDNSPALKALRDKVIEFWESTDKKYVLGIDGRKIKVRSKHALLNSLFQSAGVIYAKYISVYMMQKLEEQGYCIDPFIGKPDICSMIEYHDEQDMYSNPKLYKFKTFKTKDEAKEFVNNWEGRQLSAIGESSKGFYVALPNPVSIAIEDSMKEVEEMLKIKVPMGFEYMLGRTWYDCH